MTTTNNRRSMERAGRTQAVLRGLEAQCHLTRCGQRNDIREGVLPCDYKTV
jgi:hypothetical protein